MLSSAGASKIFQLSPLAPPLHSLNAPLREPRFANAPLHHLSTPLAIVSCFLPRFATRASLAARAIILPGSPLLHVENDRRVKLFNPDGDSIARLHRPDACRRACEEEVAFF